MSTHSTARRRILPLSLLTAAAVLALSACGGGANGAGAGSAAGATPAGSPAASQPAASQPAASQPAASPPGASQPGSATQPAGSAATGHPSPARSSVQPSAAGTRSGSPKPGGSDTASDAYAFAHPCAGEQVTVKAGYDAQLGATRRLIQVTNTGGTACGLSFYPLVAIDAAATVRGGSGQVQTVQPAVPGDLGDGQGYPLQAGHTAYAVIDLNPGHGTAGASRQYDELSVIASTSLPNAYTVSTAITEQGGSPGNPYVKSPFLGRYSDTIADAAATAVPGH
ncbi:hypothetical protein GCM10009665_24570 [Kitasatospora nipponensis]|uniref:DUF4232 domain-containing protein n=1 Tax=Kitasatospora nipponensis TaxID=258049 RepID=A0ABN1W5F0_9ACTN